MKRSQDRRPPRAASASYGRATGSLHPTPKTLDERRRDRFRTGATPAERFGAAWKWREGSLPDRPTSPRPPFEELAIRVRAAGNPNRCAARYGPPCGDRRRLVAWL